MFTITFKNERYIKDRIKRINGDLRSMFRVVNKRFTETVSEELRLGFMEHNVTGEHMDTIRDDIGDNQWQRRVSFSKVLLYVDQGTRPHAVPSGALSDWADAHNIPESSLWRTIKEKGTQPHPFINDALNRAVDRLPTIIAEEKQNILKR